MTKDKLSIKRAEDEAIQWLVRLNSSHFDQKEEQLFTQWLQESPLHQAAYIKAEQLWEHGGALVKLREPQKKNIFQFAPWQGWAFACTCLFAVAFTFFIKINAASEYDYETAFGEQKELQLEDGSHIVLNTNSKLHLTLNRKQRIVNLTQGEVFFDIKKDGRPFDVNTAQGTVRVLGTRFSVYQTAADTLVTVIEGRVGLGEKNANQNEFKPLAILQANQRLSLQSAKSGMSATKVNATTELAWRKKQLVFNGENLNQVITELSRYFPETITLENPDLGAKEITAVIQLSDLKSTLDTLALSLAIEVDYNPSTRTALLKTRTTQ
jgi:transmembrane sensor